MSTTGDSATAAAKPTIRILGGGPSGLATAFHLTSPQYNPTWKQRYDVVVYQMGWRLGGKGATGRNPDAFNRIEEHGIHLFGNMYANSLHMLYAALQELGQPNAMDTEFEPSNFQLVSDFLEGRWHGFEGWLPNNDEKPWMHGVAGDITAICEGVISTVYGIWDASQLPPPPKPGPQPSAGLDPIGALIAWLEELLTSAETKIDQELQKPVQQRSPQLDIWIWEFVQVDLVTACMRGVDADNILGNGIDSIDSVPYRDWLIRNQLHPLTQASAIVQAIPNTCMQYPDGDTTGFGDMSAAAYLTFVLRQMVAPGNAAYFFRVSTGETVILPLYQVLLKRGVRFDFFSKISDLVPDSTGTNIVRIERSRQATSSQNPPVPYQPLVKLTSGQLVWPNAPLYDQLKEGPTLKAKKIDLESWWADWSGTPDPITVNPGDVIVVALPPAAQALVCATAAGAVNDPNKRWKNMLANVKTCATQAVQIWLDQTTSTLGWPDLMASDPKKLTTNRYLGPTFTNPLSAFADFSRAIASEAWPANAAPRGLIYFCGPLQDPDPIPGFDDHDYPKREKERVRAEATQYLRQLGGLLPNAANIANRGGFVSEPNSIDFGVLHCYQNDATTFGENRFEQQYYRANIDPNERYTISTPGSLTYRVSPWQSGYARVVLSSDAVFTGFNIGSFEGAVMSGMLAAYAITGGPSLDQIYGYDFCRPNPPKSSGPILPPPK